MGKSYHSEDEDIARRIDEKFHKLMGSMGHVFNQSKLLNNNREHIRKNVNQKYCGVSDAIRKNFFDLLDISQYNRGSLEESINDLYQEKLDKLNDPENQELLNVFQDLSHYSLVQFLAGCGNKLYEQSDYYCQKHKLKRKCRHLMYYLQDVDNIKDLWQVLLHFVNVDIINGYYLIKENMNYN